MCWAGETLRAAGDTPPHKNAGLAALAGWTGPAYTPIYLELRALIAGDAWALDATADPPGVKWLREYLRAQLTPEGCEACVDDLFDLLRAGRAAILLDGLDEVSQAADERRRAQIQTFVGELAEEFRCRADHHHRAALRLRSGRLALARLRTHDSGPTRPTAAG